MPVVTMKTTAPILEACLCGVSSLQSFPKVAVSPFISPYSVHSSQQPKPQLQVQPTICTCLSLFPILILNTSTSIPINPVNSMCSKLKLAFLPFKSLILRSPPPVYQKKSPHPYPLYPVSPQIPSLPLSSALIIIHFSLPDFP